LGGGQPGADGGQRDLGNRVVGASGPKHEARKISPTSGAIDATAGVVIKPRHIHAALRKYLGIETMDPRFNLKVPSAETFDLFSNNAEHRLPGV